MTDQVEGTRCDWPFCRAAADVMMAYSTFDGYAALKCYCDPHAARASRLRQNPRWTVDVWRKFESIPRRHTPIDN